MEAVKPSGPLGRRPEVDGLRAVAVAAVMLYHFGLGCPGGFAGVDVFFVISGYLIVGILLREMDHGGFSFAQFWARRVRRLFPALAAVLCFTLAAGWRMLEPREFESLGAQAVAALAFLANFRMMAITGYWEPLAEEIPLMHTWSLAVEEQFYLVAPALLFFLWRRARRRIGAILAALWLASFAAMVAAGDSASGAAFYMPHTRAWELLSGGLLAVAEFRGWRVPRAAGPACGWLGLGLVLAAVFGLSGQAGWPDGRALLPTLGAALLIASNTARPNSSGRLLGWRPLEFTGLISYSLYLWHWPLLLFWRRWIFPEEIQVHDQIALLALTFAVSWGSWRWIEQPFRRQGVGARPLLAKPILAKPILALGCVWLALMGVSLWVKLERGFESAYYARFDPVARRVMQSPDGKAHATHEALGSLERGGIQVGGGIPRIVILGDSHAVMFGPMLEDLARRRGVALAFMAQSGAAGFLAGGNGHIKPFLSTNAEKRRRDAVVASFIERWRPDLVVLMGKWDSQLRHDWAPTEPGSEAEFARALDHTLEWLRGLSCDVALVGQPPVLPLPNRPNRAEILAGYLRRGGVMPAFYERPDTRAARLRAMELFRARASGHVFVLDPEPLLTNPDGSIRYHDGDLGLFYSDDDHLNDAGTSRLRELFEPLFDKAASAKP